jgi:hypothetical protein
MGAELLESLPVLSMRPQAIPVEVPALQFDLCSPENRVNQDLSISSLGTSWNFR